MKSKLMILGAAALVAAGALAADAVSAQTAPLSQRHPARPNILIIVTDDQRAGTMAQLPQTQQWLRAHGTRFEQAFVTTPQCCPSRSTIFSGRYAHNHGVKDNHQALNLDQSATMQAYLDARYHTGIFGKYLNSWPLRRKPPYADEWATTPRSGVYRGAKYNIDGVVQRVRQYDTTFLSDLAVNFVTQNTPSNRPWLLYLAPMAPHTPFTPQKKYADAPVSPMQVNPAMREDDPAVDPGGLSDKPQYVQDSGFTFKRGRKLHDAQARTLMSVDDMIARLHSALKTSGELNNTLVIFTSDNGLLWGEHSRNGKAVPYTPSIKVPFLMSWPDGGYGARQKDSRLIGNVDIAPTVLDAAGIRAPSHPEMDGHSLLDSTVGRDRMLTEFWDRNTADVPTWASERTLNHQYVEYYRPGETLPFFREYYDLASDPYQLHNLLGDTDRSNNPTGHVARLSRELRADRTCAGITCP